MADSKITQLTEVTSLSDSDLFAVVVNVGTTPETKKVKKSNAVPSAFSEWNAGTGTWSYSSADAPTFVISVNNDQTGIISVGMRIKLTQTTVKYFIVTAVGAYSGGATLITVYGGTDYTLANAAITSPYVSSAKAPLGFPTSPLKWQVTVTDTSDRTQASPTQNTWYNAGSITASMPIGSWHVYFDAAIGATVNGTSINAWIALSTANNSASDPNLTSFVAIGGATSASMAVYSDASRSAVVDAASKTAYYLNFRTTTASVANLYMFNSTIHQAIITFRCAYL